MHISKALWTFHVKRAMEEAADFDLIHFASQFDLQDLENIPTQTLFKVEDPSGECQSHTPVFNPCMNVNMQACLQRHIKTMISQDHENTVYKIRIFEG